ncbi:MAG: thioesterase [Pelagibacteraceae bacterium]|nr:thioesterase [Pelagibacteraceae bacterium]
MSVYLRTEKIIPDWTDYNGHMNLAFYIHLFDQGWDVLLDKFDMGGESAKNQKRSTFAVESHTKYLKEVKEGEMVDINLLSLDHDSKRLIYQLEIYNKEKKYRAATSEVCSVYVNLELRKVVEMEDNKLKLIESFIIENKSKFKPEKHYLIHKLKKTS